MSVPPLLVVLPTQLLFTTSDVLARTNLKEAGFTRAGLLAPWLLVYLLVRQVATVGQLYVFSNDPDGDVGASRRRPWPPCPGVGSPWTLSRR